MQVQQAGAGQRVFDRHVRAGLQHFGEQRHFQCIARRQRGLAGLGGQYHGACADGDPHRRAQTGARTQDQRRAARRCDGGAGQLQHLAGIHLRGGMRHGFEIVDQADVVEAEPRAQVGQRQAPR